MISADVDLSPVKKLADDWKRKLLCIVCGSYYSLQELDAHQVKCRHDRNEELSRLKSLLPVPIEAHFPALSFPVPSASDCEALFEQYNSFALESFQRSRVICPGPCRRNFGVDRLEAHLRKCKPELLLEGHARQLQGPSISSLLLCYGCGAYFHAEQLPSHMDSCLSGGVPATARYRPMSQPLPSASSKQEAIDRWNESALQRFQSGLVTCDVCGRKFQEERIETHVAVCKGPAAGSDASGSSSSDDIATSRLSSLRLPDLVCYLCSRRFAHDVLERHQDVCLRQREADWRKFPGNVDKKFLPPPVPSLPRPIASSEVSVFQRYNEAAIVLFSKSLIPCSKCGRSFNHRALRAHVHVCVSKSSPLSSFRHSLFKAHRASTAESATDGALSMRSITTTGGDTHRSVTRHASSVRHSMSRDTGTANSVSSLSSHNRPGPSTPPSFSRDGTAPSSLSRQSRRGDGRSSRIPKPVRRPRPVSRPRPDSRPPQALSRPDTRPDVRSDSRLDTRPENRADKQQQQHQQLQQQQQQQQQQQSVVSPRKTVPTQPSRPRPSPSSLLSPSKLPTLQYRASPMHSFPRVSNQVFVPKALYQAGTTFLKSDQARPLSAGESVAAEHMQSSPSERQSTAPPAFPSKPQAPFEHMQPPRAIQEPKVEDVEEVAELHPMVSSASISKAPTAQSSTRLPPVPSARSDKRAAPPKHADILPDEGDSTAVSVEPVLDDERLEDLARMRNRMLHVGLPSITDDASQRLGMRPGKLVAASICRHCSNPFPGDGPLFRFCGACGTSRM